MPSSTQEIATAQASTDVNALFTTKTQSIIEQAIKSSSGRIKVQLIRDYLWPEFSKLIPEGGADTALVHNGEESRDDLTTTLQQTIEKLQKSRQRPPEESSERQTANQELLQEFKQKADQLQNKPMRAEAQNQSTDMSERTPQDTEQELSPEQVAEQLSELQELMEQLGDIELIDQNEELEHFTYDIREIGINEDELNEQQLELLNNMREFCQKTSLLYAKTMRFVMQAYQERNPNFTDSMLERMMLHHHDTPSFTIYGQGTAKDFIENGSPELGIERFETDGFLLNFNLPKLIGRYWYRGGNGNLSQPVEEGAIEWGHFYRSCMPVIWNSVDQTVSQGMLFDRINAFGQHDYQKYYYLYDVNRLPFELPHESTSESGELDNSDEAQSNGGDGNQNGSEDGGDGSESGAGESGAGTGAGLGEDGQSAGEPGFGEANSGEQQALGDSDQLNGDFELNNFEEALQALQASLQGSETGTPGGLEELISQLQQRMNQLQEPGGGNNPDGQDQGYPMGNEISGSENPVSDDNEEQSQGGYGNSRELSKLLGQLQDIQRKIDSPLAHSRTNDVPIQELELTDEEMVSSAVESIENLEQIKQSQQRQLEALYREQSGLSGQALERYIDYREETRGFTGDLVEYFTDKFKLDKDYTYANNQRRGARLQKGWTNRVLGTTAAGPVIEPAVFERKSIPKSPQFVWSLIIDNSGSCGGDIIEEEKKTAVALVEVAKQLNIPLEIVTFGGSNDYQFLKTFDQDLFGDELAQLVRLNADEGTPDVATLNAACESVGDFADQFNRPYNFVYFMTDGESGSGSIASVIDKFKRDMVITGIGLAGAALSIANSWGRNSVGVEDVRQLSDVLIRKIENQIEETFD